MQLAAVAVPSIASGQYHQGIPLEEDAARLYPDSAHNQAAWVSAVQYLRSKRVSMWTLDKLVTASGSTKRY